MAAPPRSSAVRSASSKLLQALTATAIIVAVGAVVWLKVLHTTRESPTAAIARLTGRSVTCTTVGEMALAEGNSTVLRCTDPTGYHACWADLGSAVSDVTDEVRGLKPAGSTTSSSNC